MSLTTQDYRGWKAAEDVGTVVATNHRYIAHLNYRYETPYELIISYFVKFVHLTVKQTMAPIGA